MLGNNSISTSPASLTTTPQGAAELEIYLLPLFEYLGFRGQSIILIQ